MHVRPPFSHARGPREPPASAYSPASAARSVRCSRASSTSRPDRCSPSRRRCVSTRRAAAPLLPSSLTRPSVPPATGHPRQDPPPLAVARRAPRPVVLCVAPGDRDRPGPGARIARVGLDARDGRAVRCACPPRFPLRATLTWRFTCDGSTRRPKRGPQFAVMKKLLTLLIDHPSSWAFANPVNAQEVRLAHFFLLV